MTDESLPPQESPKSTWRPLPPIERRVLGVLAEKAKTTPDAYPMSLNAVTTGCNQKSNRAPLMNLDPADVEESLDRLREMGAVGLVQGYGRVSKYRHYVYEWLGVDKVELAVMTELLLRGAQTEGELRGRAARMEPIADLAALRPVLDSLIAKGLVLSLSPEGRGHVVSHSLYSPQELAKLKAEFGAADAGVSRTTSTEPNAAHPCPPRPCLAPATSPAIRPMTPSGDAADPLRREVAELRVEVGRLRHELSELIEQVRAAEDQLRGFRDALGG